MNCISTVITPAPLHSSQRPSSVLEGEILWCESHLLGQRLVGKDLPYLVIGLHVSSWVRACTLAYRVLVDELDMVNLFQSRFESEIFAGSIGNLIEMTLRAG